MSQRTYYSEDAKNKAQFKMSALAAFCLAIGATIGTAIAILFAPQTGEDTREELGEVSQSAFEKLQNQIDDLRKRFDNAMS